METGRNKILHPTRPVLTREIRGWKGSAAFVNIGLSAAVLALVVFDVVFFSARVELPTEIEAADIEGPGSQVEVVETPSRKDVTYYTRIASRNIFSPDRKEWEGPLQKNRQYAEGELDGDLAKKSGLTLIGVAIVGGAKMALIKDKKGTRLFREGEQVGGYKLFSIEPDRVYMSSDGRTFTIELYEATSGLSAGGQSWKEEDQ